MDPSAVATPFIPPDIVLLTAPQLLGVMFNWGLWGILTVQVYLYHLCFNDSWRIKTLVYGLYVLECLQTALSSADIFHWFAFGWGRLEILADPYVNPIDLPLMAGVIALIVQLYFTWRIWVLGRSAILTVFIAAVSLTQAGAGIAAGIMAMQIGDLRALQDLVAPKIWLAGAALSDTLIAAAMTYFLVRARNNSHVPKTNFILKRIITLTIETNSLSASVAIITLALFIKYPGNSLFLCPPYALGKLYSNTLLVIFNNRMAMPLERSQQHASIGLSGMGSSGTALNHGGLHNDHHSRREDGIKITVLRESDRRDEHLRDSPTV
ncbi:hypothetical protein BDQ12DRAFT_725284 [Crucibulum laeve]|uniref:DUF6534 domain-containing protein n=1 Tax=Crucibulum laeve TaxID=68775 RepID=A0A5C3LVU3_9AGAR|nr:hypothetical protein BDQ12DRAFT_725284 [Crucibulum laeve]